VQTPALLGARLLWRHLRGRLAAGNCYQDAQGTLNAVLGTMADPYVQLRGVAEGDPLLTPQDDAAEGSSMAALPPLPEGPWGVNPDAAAAALAGRRVALAQRETALQRWAAALGLEAAQAAAAAANLAAAQQQVCSPGFASWLCCCKRPLLEQAAQRMRWRQTSPPRSSRCRVVPSLYEPATVELPALDSGPRNT